MRNKQKRRTFIKILLSFFAFSASSALTFKRGIKTKSGTLRRNSADASYGTKERDRMETTNYGKYIITEPKPNVWDLEEGNVKDGPDVMSPVTYLDDKVLEGAFYIESSWFWKANKFSPPAHTHDFDEVLAFFGSDPNDPQNLCGEVELWLGDEKHILTKSCTVFIPRGLKHCPMLVLRADRPIFHFAAGNTTRYSKEKM